MQLKIVNPFTEKEWNTNLLSFSQYILFHTREWAQVLCETYKYETLYFMFSENEKLFALVPLIQVDSVFTRKRGVSLPFSDSCEPLIANSVNKENFEEILKTLVEYGRSAGSYYIELYYFRLDLN